MASVELQHSSSEVPNYPPQRLARQRPTFSGLPSAVPIHGPHLFTTPNSTDAVSIGHTISSPVLHGSRSPPVPAAPGFRSGSPEPVARPLMQNSYGSYPRQGSPMVTTYRRQGSPITWRQGNPSLGAYGRQGSPTSLATYGRQGNPTSLATYGRQGSTLWSPGASFIKVIFSSLWVPVYMSGLDFKQSVGDSARELLHVSYVYYLELPVITLIIPTYPNISQHYPFGIPLRLLSQDYPIIVHYHLVAIPI